MTLTKAALKKMSKDDIITLALDYQDKFNSSLANINKDLRELKYKFEKLESELAVSKQSILISVILLFVCCCCCC